jgi:hypothetical protein
MVLELEKKDEDSGDTRTKSRALTVILERGFGTQ